MVRAPFEPVAEFPRLGYLFEVGGPDRSEVPALLHFDHQRGLYIEVPFAAESHEAAGRWFGRKPVECPDQLVFEDHELDLHLVGVYVATQGRDPRYEPGLGGLRAEFAVEDRDRSNVDYAQVEAVRSEIDGLHEFMGWSLAEMDFSSPPETPGPVLRVTPQTAVSVGDFDGFEVSLSATHWAGQDRPNVSAIGETTVLRTVSAAPRAVEDHLRVHEAMRDMLAVVCWKPFDFSDVEVQREDAPARSLGGTAMHATWRRLHSPYLARRHGTDPPPEVVFTDTWGPTRFEAIGSNGLATWLRRREGLGRFVDPLLALRFASVITPELALMQTSIAAEALAYLHALRAGADPSTAAHESFENRLRRLVATQPLNIGGVAGDAEAWGSSSQERLQRREAREPGAAGTAIAHAHRAHADGTAARSPAPRAWSRRVRCRETRREPELVGSGLGVLKADRLAVFTVFSMSSRGPTSSRLGSDAPAAPIWTGATVATI